MTEGVCPFGGGVRTVVATTMAAPMDETGDEILRKAGGETLKLKLTPEKSCMQSNGNYDMLSTENQVNCVIIKPCS